MKALTNREYEIASLIAQGMSRREIATKLFITKSTVYSHSYSICKKLKIRSFQLPWIFATNPPRKKASYRERFEKLSLNHAITSQELSQIIGCSIELSYRFLSQKNLLVERERILIQWKGIDYSIRELANLTNTKYHSLYNRICILGWTVEEAIAKK